jgi:hypothetical protein
MPDSFHIYLKKQLLDYIEAERKKGIPLEEIEKVLLNAGHDKNIIDEVKIELIKEESGKKVESIGNPVEKDISSQLKNAFSMFMAKASKKEIESAEKDIEKTDTNEIVKEVIDEAEVIEEKNMFESAAFFCYLVVLGVIILFTAGASQSELKNVVMGFLPAIISVFASFVLLSMADNVPLYVFIPFGISGVFYAIIRFSGLALFGSLDPEGLGIINFIIGFIFNVMVVYIRFVKPNHMKRKVIKKGPQKHSYIHHAFKKREEIEELKKEYNM